MIIKPKEIEIPENEPFKNDALDRKESAEVLTQFVLSANEPLVICIDASWGQGKTTFLRMWRQYLKKSGIHTVYFNAWENDFSDDAMISLIGEISTSLSELDEKHKSKAEIYFNNAKRIGINLFKQSAPALVSIGTGGILNIDKEGAEELAGIIKSFDKDQAGKLEQVEQYEKSKGAIQQFRESLSEFAANISAGKDHKPLIFMIDELDRCRPDYAIEVLEKAKHFFNVENIIFVLGAHKEQLGVSIQSLYGKKLDVNGYLRRFIDIDYSLPSPDKGKFVAALFEKYDFYEYFSQESRGHRSYEHEQALTMFRDLFELYKLTLREQEHCCSLLSIAIRTIRNDQDIFPLLLCFLIVLKISNKDLYDDFIGEGFSSQQMLEHIRSLSGGNELLRTNYGVALEAYIVTSKSDQIDYEKISDEYMEIRNSDSFSREEQDRAFKVLQVMDHIHRDHLSGVRIFKNLVRRIEIAVRFES